MAQPLRTRIASYLLGTFVCVELAYLPFSNLLQPIPRQMPPLPAEILGRIQTEGRATSSETGQAVIDGTGRACDHWAEATAQGQGWSLFAPRFGEAGTFLTLQVTTDAGPVELRSRFEPADPEHYVRFDVTHYRQFYREMSYALVYSMWTPDSFVTQGPEWRDTIREYVAAFRHTLPAYVRWRVEQELPTATIREVIVCVRVILPLRAGDARPEPITVPMASWKPNRGNEIAAFDPVTNEFRIGDSSR